MHSMTAFARKEVTLDFGCVNLEMRTVNHRYLDMNLRLAEELRFFEPKARQLIGEKLSRGRVDLTLKFKPISSEQVSLNQAMVKHLLSLQQQLKAINADAEPLTSAEILNWPGALEMAAQDERQMMAALVGLLSESLAELVSQRAREGQKIKSLLADKAAEIKSLVSQIRTILPEVSQDFRATFVEKLSQLEVDIDSHRIEQELVVFLGKQDIAEELDRLDVHLDEVINVLDAKKSSGRRLDFLMQELNREANTLTSKSVDVRLNNAAVDMKVLIEQMREQVQNIE